jgi:hypothetical protein
MSFGWNASARPSSGCLQGLSAHFVIVPATDNQFHVWLWKCHKDSKSNVNGFPKKLSRWLGHCTPLLESEHKKIERAPHSAYSPDISPCGFWLFGFLKEKLKEQELSTSDESVRVLRPSGTTSLWRVAERVLQMDSSNDLGHWTRGSLPMNDCYNFLREFYLVEKAREARIFWTRYSGEKICRRRRNMPTIRSFIYIRDIPEQDCFRE